MRDTNVCTPKFIFTLLTLKIGDEISVVLFFLPYNKQMSVQ